MKVKELFETSSRTDNFKEGFMSSLFKSGTSPQSKMVHPRIASTAATDQPDLKYHVVSKLDGYVVSSHRSEAEAKMAAHGNRVEHGDTEIKNGVKYMKNASHSRQSLQPLQWKM
jgi:hypothetical protein